MNIGDDDEFEGLDGTPESDEDGGEVLVEDVKDDTDLPPVVEIEGEGDDDFEDLEAPVPGDLDDEVLADADEGADEDDDLDDGGDADDDQPVETLDDELERAMAGGEGPDDLSDIKSEKIKDRIMRERRKAGEAVEQANRVDSSMREMRTKTWDTLHGVHSRRIAEVSAMGQSVVDAAEQVLELNRERVKQARESGNTDAEFAATDAIASWTKVLEQVKPVLAKAKDDKGKIDAWRKGLDPKSPLVDGAPAAAPAASGQQPGQQQSSEVPEMAREWVSRNPWFNEDRHLDVRSFAAGVEQQLLKAKYKNTDPQMYRLIARAIAKRFPELTVVDVKGKRVAGTTEKEARRRRPRKGDEGVSTRTGTPRGKRRAGTKVTKLEAAKMRQFQLDPTNPAQVKEWRANATPPPKSRRRESARQVV